MPHITAYLTRNISEVMDIPRLLADIVAAVHAADPKEFPLPGLRARSVVSEHWHAADGNPDNATIHVELRLIAGRSDELLAKVAASVLDMCEKSASRYAGKPMSLSVEFADMARSHYYARNSLKA